MAKKNSIEYFNEALQSIRTAEQRKPVYCFTGEEGFFIDLLQEEISGLIPVENQDFNLDLLYGSEMTPARVLGIARSFPMMAPVRVVIVRDFLKMRGRESQDGHINDFISYMNHPNPTTILLFVDEKSPDKRTHLGKALTSKKSSHVYFQKFDKLPDHRLPDWVSKWVSKKYKKSIEPKAAQILAQMVGNDLKVLSTEIDKVCTFVDSETEIKTGHVKKVIGSYREYSVIELKEAVISRNLEKSLSIMEQMLLKSNTEAGEVIRTVGFFYSVFGNIWQIRRLAEKGMTKSRVQQEMGITSSWYFNQLWKDSSNFRSAEMPQIFEALLDADQAVKGFSTLDTPTILLLLIKRIAG